MRTSGVWTALLAVVLGLTGVCPAKAKRRPLLPPKLLAAKSVYFDNQTGFDAVGNDAVRELKKWGRFQIVERREQADMLLILSSEYDFDLPGQPPKGSFEPDQLKLPRRPVNAYLAAVDPATGQRLWSDSRPWGGLLTGFNSAGWRLINKLHKEIDDVAGAAR